MQATDLGLLKDAAKEAGALALRHAAGTLDITHKPDGAGPVTDADLAVDALLRERLMAARPDFGWLSEETPDTRKRLTPRHTFIVDPIDGTRAFIEGSRDWAHSIAVALDGEITAAVVYLPARDALFTAELGGGASLNGAPIRVSACNDLAQGTVLTTKPTLDPDLWQGGLLPEFKRAFRSSLAWRLCLVAEGAFDAMMTLRPAWEWDIAAGALIVSEAGGRVTDRQGRPLRFNNPHPQTNGVLAGGEQMHTALFSALA
ncbi:MAG: 3'(2'),5'-bisphosphate nucleotidase CysQ [Flavimaricola sp.]|nr:3'(2'),5'-bisphosphate nucleotidase CysQ [Flavimaricola sp.]